MATDGQGRTKGVSVLVDELERIVEDGKLRAGGGSMGSI